MAWTGKGIDPSVPNAARMYDYWLGGKDNYPADRAAAEKITEVFPGSAQACRDNRSFLRRSVRFLADAGIRQFIDIGSGLPTADNTHQIAHQVAPDARIVYVDYDPVVYVHAMALLAKGERSVIAFQGDVREPESIIAAPQVRGHIDFSRPLAFLCVAVMHFIEDEDKPYQVMQVLRDAMPPGSYLALSHITPEHASPGAVAVAREVYAGASARIAPRTRAEITGLFDGLELVEPGLVDINDWHPGLSTGKPPDESGRETYIYGAVAGKR